jgi:DNA-binding MarR family transcriptional regulator
MMLIHMTAKGRAALEEILPVHFKRMATLMSPLSENERKTLVRLLNKVAAQAAVMAVDTDAVIHALPV